MRDLIDEFTPGNYNLGNVTSMIVCAMALYLYVEGQIQTNTLVILIGAALGSESLIDLGKKNA